MYELIYLKYTLKIMCTTNISHIMLTHFTSLWFGAIMQLLCKHELNCSACDNLHKSCKTAHIYLRPFIFFALKHQTVRFLELYKWKSFLRSLLCDRWIKWKYIHFRAEWIKLQIHFNETLLLILSKEECQVTSNKRYLMLTRPHTAVSC